MLSKCQFEHSKEITDVLLHRCVNNRKYQIRDRIAEVPIFSCLSQRVMEFRNLEFRVVTVSVEFEVRGEIQGLYFLKHCKDEAFKLGICGWVKRDRRGAILGIVQGQKSRVEQMICWLSNKGAPGSRIEEYYFYNYRYISKPDYRNFNVRF